MYRSIGPEKADTQVDEKTTSCCQHCQKCNSREYDPSHTQQPQHAHCRLQCWSSRSLFNFLNRTTTCHLPQKTAQRPRCSSRHLNICNPTSRHAMLDQRLDIGLIPMLPAARAHIGWPLFLLTDQAGEDGSLPRYEPVALEAQAASQTLLRRWTCGNSATKKDTHDR